MTTPVFRQVDQPLEVRAQDLLAQLTPDERLAMLHQAAPAIERLGVAEFRTGCEALHGVAWLGTATVFPQPIGLAATWDTDLIEKVGEVASTEVRAKRAENPLVSLNAWAPVVNTLRHPAWGRNEEGYSEDPHVTAHFATAYAQGLRGRDERVWRTVPALKHFLGYSNETDRSTTDSELSLRTLHEEELPAFRGPFEAGVAGSMMLSYNRVNGAPAHTQPELVAEARSWADGSIAVVSDAGAPTFLVTTQRAVADHVSATVALLTSGLDSFTDNDANAQPTIGYLREALADGRLTTDDIDRAVTRILELRLRTGEFDAEADPYGSITADDIDLPASRALARESVARRSSCCATTPACCLSRHRRASPSSGPSPTPCSPTGTPARRPMPSASARLRRALPRRDRRGRHGRRHRGAPRRSNGRYLVADASGSVVEAVGHGSGRRSAVRRDGLGRRHPVAAIEGERTARDGRALAPPRRRDAGRRLGRAGELPPSRARRRNVVAPAPRIGPLAAHLPGVGPARRRGDDARIRRALRRADGPLGPSGDRRGRGARRRRRRRGRQRPAPLGPRDRGPPPPLPPRGVRRALAHDRRSDSRAVLAIVSSYPYILRGGMPRPSCGRATAVRSSATVSSTCSRATASPRAVSRRAGRRPPSRRATSSTTTRSARARPTGTRLTRPPSPSGTA